MRCISEKYTVLQGNRAAEGERIEQNACGRLAAERLDCLGVIAELPRMLLAEFLLRLCPTAVQTVGLVVHKDNIALFVVEETVDDPLHQNVLVIPHLGASTPESEENCAAMAAKQLRDFFETGTIVNSVNMPE